MSAAEKKAQRAWWVDLILAVITSVGCALVVSAAVLWLMDGGAR